MKRTVLIAVGVVYALCITLLSCDGRNSSDDWRRIDSLNQRAYAYRYKDLDSSFQAAHEAYHSALDYKMGRAEASNNLGFCAFMRMDFAEAERRHLEVYRLTKSELELLIADVGLMKIYQRTAQNKEFYDHRISALRRMKRIDEDDNRSFVHPHERRRLVYARSEFHIVSAIYYYYLQQRPDAVHSIDLANADDVLKADTNQLLYYHYIKGSAALCEGESPNERRLKEFDELFLTWRMASRGGYIYFEGNAMQGLAGLMMTPRAYEFFAENRPYVLNQFGVPADTLLPRRLAELALGKFQRYNDLYQIAGAYVSIGRYHNMHGNYRAALDTLNRALDYVEGHRPAVPEWILRIREQLSVAYAGLGRKQDSDFNRNVYLDILDASRQDRELESRYEALEEEAHQLNLLLNGIGVGILLLLVVCWFFNKRSKERSRKHQEKLRRVLDLSQQITASIPADAEDEEEIHAALQAVIGTDVEPEMLRVVNPYIRWALDNGRTSLTLEEERRRLEKQRYIHEQHIAENKRQNIIKKACLAIVAGIHPYIDRIINEADKLLTKGYINDPSIKAEKLQYIDELVSTINQYNDLLAEWIKMKQGSLSLHIESFPLNDLFDLLRKGTRAFELKQQTLEVIPTDAIVRADKALTLFMLNTLAENSRKYTPQGGRITIAATQADGYVEISVSDTGRGLSEADVARILGEKVYDSQRIGISDAANPDELRRSKGSGFGLMNCKGIIEKYRKTNELFRVCLFGVQSRLGEGSRFFFRLPVGIRRVLTILLLLIGTRANLYAIDSLALAARLEYEALLDSASDYADAAYYSNVDGRYGQTILYVDSAMMCLNDHYLRYAPEPLRLMSLRGEGRPAELAWWEEYFNTDYHIILDIRNEAAVAFLALREWDAYTYNNTAYTTLYKLLGEDQSLEEYCRLLERSTTHKLVGIALAVLLLIALVAGFYFLYLRKRLMLRWNLEQVLEVNERVLAASRLHSEESLSDLPRRLLDSSFGAINELLSIHRLHLATLDASTDRLDLCSTPAGRAPQEFIHRCFDAKRFISERHLQAVPLLIDTPDEQRCIGVLCLERRPGTEREGDVLFLELIARYVAIVIFNDLLKLSGKYRDIEEAHDETLRASWEDSQLHVQNQVLDNCLSTIKHETLYYPNKIKQLITRLRSGQLSPREEQETVRSVSELIAYYKEIFTILHACAARQLEEVTFRRTTIPVSLLLAHADKYFRRMSKGRQPELQFVTEGIDADVMGDVHQLRFLLENLIDEALSFDQPQSYAANSKVYAANSKVYAAKPQVYDPETSGLRGENLTFTPQNAVVLSVKPDGDFIRFTFTDLRRSLPQEELNRLFYPDIARTEYLVCKQIIRDHDEFAGRRGCRINAEAEAGGGFSIYFTLPVKRKSNLSN